MAAAESKPTISLIFPPRETLGSAPPALCSQGWTAQRTPAEAQVGLRGALGGRVSPAGAGPAHIPGIKVGDEVFILASSLSLSGVAMRPV